MSSLRDSAQLIHFTLAHRRVRGKEFSFAGHEYLRGLYLDESPLVIIRKAAQMGASEYAISRALWFAITHGGTAMYYFPTDHDVGEFSRDRFGPAVAESPYFSSLIRETDTVGLKQIGPGSIYFRGMRSTPRMKSVPGDFVIFDEVDEMKAANLDLARKRLGHSQWGWELMLSTPSLPDYGIDAAFADSDQRHWVLRCEQCRKLWCLEDEFLAHHGSPSDPRTDICFIQGPPGAETLVCQRCGRPLDPARGEWLPKYARPAHGYHLSKLFSSVLSEAERKLGAKTKPAALLSQYRRTENPAEFFKSELGLPYLAIDGGLSMADLRVCVGTYGQCREHRGCVMGVDQNEGLHIVLKWADTKADLVYTLAVHHEPHTNADFSVLDHFMEAFDVRLCVIDAQPGIHAARAFAKRHSGRVRLAYYGPSQNGLTTLKVDHEGTPTITISRTEAFDRWRDLYQKLRRRIPRSDEVVEEYMRQMTQIVRTIDEDPETGEKRARWVRRGPDHFAHADCYAEMAIRALGIGLVRATVLGGDEW